MIMEKVTFSKAKHMKDNGFEAPALRKGHTWAKSSSEEVIILQINTDNITCFNYSTNNLEMICVNEFENFIYIPDANEEHRAHYNEGIFMQDLSTDTGVIRIYLSGVGDSVIFENLADEYSIAMTYKEAVKFGLILSNYAFDALHHNQE